MSDVLGDLAACKGVLRQLHAVGIEHGDLSRHNFIIDEATQKVYMIESEHCNNLKEDTVERECACLSSELAGESGRGAGFVDWEE